MSVWTDLGLGIRNLVLLQDTVDRLQATAEQSALQIADHERRLVRIETLIEMAKAGRLTRD